MHADYNISTVHILTVALFPLAAQSSANVSNVSEVESIPLGMYNYQYFA